MAKIMAKIPAFLNPNGTMNNPDPGKEQGNGLQPANIFKEPSFNDQPTAGLSKVAGGTQKTPNRVKRIEK